MAYEHEHTVFDTETTGVFGKTEKWDVDYMKFPHIVQLSWKFSDSDEVNDFIIKPEGYEIPVEAAEVHGISTETALEKGVPLSEVIEKFIKDCESSRLIIGHNLYFDTSIVKANILRIMQENKESGQFEVLIDRAVTALDKDKRVNTMSYPVVAFCKLPFPNAKPGSKSYKYPKLTELYKILFNEEFNAHNSKDDLVATERCYHKLLDLGVLKPIVDAEIEEKN